MTLDAAVAKPRNLSRDAMVHLLATDDPAEIRELFAAAQAVKARCGRTAVLPRGLIECSNVCAKDCRYCGIRRSHAALPRYTLTEAEVAACLAEARRRGYPAVAFQAGEVESEANTAYYERLLASCRDLEVTLALGEQTEAVYRRWREAGARRYLLRIETSSRRLYETLHPATCSFDRRVECLRSLKRLGYVTGSGVMIGLPGQTLGDLADDLVFFGAMNLDMVGMGPFLPHPATPLAHAPRAPFDAFLTTLKLIALTRLYLQDVNLVAATALEVLSPSDGRARALAAGANVIMPNLTPTRQRVSYELYPGKSAAVS